MDSSTQARKRGQDGVSAGTRQGCLKERIRGVQSKGISASTKLDAYPHEINRIEILSLCKKVFLHPRLYRRISAFSKLNKWITQLLRVSKKKEKSHSRGPRIFLRAGRLYPPSGVWSEGFSLSYSRWFVFWEANSCLGGIKGNQKENHYFFGYGSSKQHAPSWQVLPCKYSATPTWGGRGSGKKVFLDAPQKHTSATLNVPPNNEHMGFSPNKGPLCEWLL